MPLRAGRSAAGHGPDPRPLGAARPGQGAALDAIRGAGRRRGRLAQPPGSQVGFRQGWLPLGPAQRQEGPLAGAGGSLRWPRSPAQRAHCGPLPTDFSN